MVFVVNDSVTSLVSVEVLIKEYYEILEKMGYSSPIRGKVKVGSKPKYYYFANYYGYGYWVVRRTINGERHNFGHFKSEAEAQQKVRELDSNGWEGLL